MSLTTLQKPKCIVCDIFPPKFQKLEIILKTKKKNHSIFLMFSFGNQNHLVIHIVENTAKDGSLHLYPAKSTEAKKGCP